MLRTWQTHFKADTLNGASLKEIQDWRSSLRTLVLRLMKRRTGNSAGGRVDLGHAGSEGDGGGLIRGEVVGSIDDSHQVRHGWILSRESERTDRRGDIRTLTESVCLQRHGLPLGKTRLLNRDTIEQNSRDGDAIDGGMHENIGRYAGFAESRGGH